MILEITKHDGCKIMATHEVREMVLDEPIREALTMSASIEAKKTNVKPYDDRAELAFTNRMRKLRKENNLF